MQQLEKIPETKKTVYDLENILLKKFKPQNPVEKASLATVTVKSRIGSGSGFFISRQGHIITNKHVLQGDQKRIKTTNAYFKKTEKKINRIEEKLQAEEEKLQQTKAELQAYKDEIDDLRNEHTKKIETEKYRMHLNQYQEWEEDLARRKRLLAEKKSKFEAQMHKFRTKTSLAKSDRYFDIILKNKMQLSVRLIAISNDFDLALLKLSNHKTPFLRPLSRDGIAQGEKVFAIGSPAGLKDSVSSGVVSGFENDYIKTNAHIYPGNSGGPLINAQAKVIGINTLKKLTYKFEGLGFAIPVETAFQEFQSFLH